MERGEGELVFLVWPVIRLLPSMFMFDNLWDGLSPDSCRYCFLCIRVATCFIIIPMLIE